MVAPAKIPLLTMSLRNLAFCSSLPSSAVSQRLAPSAAGATVGMPTSLPPPAAPAFLPAHSSLRFSAAVPAVVEGAGAAPAAAGIMERTTGRHGEAQ